MWFSMIVMWAVPLLTATHALKVVFSFCIITNFLYRIDKQELADVYKGAPLEV
jgi:hypothetical protein